MANYVLDVQGVGHHEYGGLSTDTKPTTGLSAGDRCYETDTYKKYHWSGAAWVEEVSSASEAFPVGAVFIAVVDTNPATLLGYGTWAAFGAGRVMVGLNSGDTDFDVAEETGGAKTATPDAHTGGAVNAHSGAGVDAHSAHSGAGVDAHSGATVGNHTDVTNHVHLQQYNSATTGPATGQTTAPDTSSNTPTSTGNSTQNPTSVGVAAMVHIVGQAVAHVFTQAAAHANHVFTQAANHVFTQPSAHAAMSVVQPYIVCYFWKRTV